MNKLLSRQLLMSINNNKNLYFKRLNSNNLNENKLIENKLNENNMLCETIKKKTDFLIYNINGVVLLTTGIAHNSLLMSFSGCIFMGISLLFK